jgi:hypothetical protein
VQDDVNIREGVPIHVLGNALDGFGRYRRPHSLRKLPPRLICHFIDVTVRAGQVASTVNFKDELPEGNGLMPCRPDLCHVEVE